MMPRGYYRPQPDCLLVRIVAIQWAAPLRKSCRIANSCSSASAAGGSMAQSGSNVLVTCRSSVRRGRTAASPFCQLEVPTHKRHSPLGFQRPLSDPNETHRRCSCAYTWSVTSIEWGLSHAVESRRQKKLRRHIQSVHKFQSTKLTRAAETRDPSANATYLPVATAASSTHLPRLSLPLSLFHR